MNNRITKIVATHSYLHFHNWIKANKGFSRFLNSRGVSVQRVEGKFVFPIRQFDYCQDSQSRRIEIKMANNVAISSNVN